MTEERVKYLLKVPLDHMAEVLHELNTRSCYVFEVKPAKEIDGILTGEVIFTCLKISGFEDFVKEKTKGKGSIAIIKE